MSDSIKLWSNRALHSSVAHNVRSKGPAAWLDIIPQDLSELQAYAHLKYPKTTKNMAKNAIFQYFSIKTLMIELCHVETPRMWLHN